MQFLMRITEYLLFIKQTKKFKRKEIYVYILYITEKQILT